MICTAQDVTVQINKLLAFFEPLQSLANAHFASFFSENVWSNHVPFKIQAELNNEKSVQDFVQLYPKIIKNNCPIEFRQKHPNLLSFIRTAQDISVGNDNKHSNSLVDFDKFFKSKGCSESSDFGLEEFMSKKKLHEVKVMSKITATLSRLTKSSHIVDVGGGKGYLSSVLALHHSLKVLGLDSSQLTTCGAIKRSEKVAQLWNGGAFKVLQEDEKMTRKTKEEFIKKYYKQVITYVTPETDIVRLLKQSFNEELEGITLTGLHTCGDLASTSLKMFLNNPKVTSIVNVGCCYHLINEEFLSDNFWESVDTVETVQVYGFPLSNYLKQKKFFLGRNARMLAAHTLERLSSELEDASQTSLLYRCILDTVIKQSSKYKSKQGQVGRLAKKCQNFKEYMYKALKKLDIDREFTDDELNKLYETYIEKRPNFTAFFLLRVTIAPVIESIILLDRLLYLIENGVSNAYLVRLFDLEISPRGFGIFAWKDFGKI